jgi:dihydropteroate synthase
MARFFDYARMMKADAEGQTDLIIGVIQALEATVERYDKEEVRRKANHLWDTGVRFLNLRLMQTRSILLMFEGKPLGISTANFVLRMFTYGKIR